MIRGGPSGDNDSEVSYIRFNFMHSLNVKSGAAKQGWTELAHSVSSPLTMWMFISWQFRQVTVYVPVSVYEIVHIAVVLFTTQHNIVEINCFCFGKQGEKFIRHILVRSEVLQVLAPSKKREGRLQVFSCRFTFLSL